MAVWLPEEADRKVTALREGEVAIQCEEVMDAEGHMDLVVQEALHQMAEVVRWVQCVAVLLG